MSPKDLDDAYPMSCPFCDIAKAYPPSVSDATSTDVEGLKKCVPESVDVDKVSPQCHLVLSAPEVLAFLDIMPMTSGHLLIISRSHRKKIEDVSGNEAQNLGFWLPILSKAVMKTINCTDYNLVQNNGPRAAQVVPHVHFHLIPRPDSVPSIQNRSWTMFGRGKREDLDDEEGAKLAAEIRRQIRGELENRARHRSLI